jgi:hypothetical protein
MGMTPSCQLFFEVKIKISSAFKDYADGGGSRSHRQSLFPL